MAAQPVLPTRFRRAHRRTVAVAGRHSCSPPCCRLRRRRRTTRGKAWHRGISRGQRRAATSTCSTTTRGYHRSTPPTGFTGIAFVNSDLAFTGDHAIVGSFNGFQVYDISDQDNPVLRSSFVCPGGQGDPSVYGDLLFISVEETRGRIDCGPPGPPGPVTPPLPRGAHLRHQRHRQPGPAPGRADLPRLDTHTLVTDPTTRTTSTSTTRAPPACGRRSSWRVRERRAHQGPGDHREPDAVADRCDQGPAGRTGDGIDRQPAADLHRPATRVPSTACRTRCRARVHPSSTGPSPAPTRRCPTPTPATTSARSRRSACSPVRARATASCWTSPTR